METKNKTVIETKSAPNHQCDPGECEAKKVLNQFKRRVQYSTPIVVIANEICEISDDNAVQLAMPKKTSCCEQSLENDKKMCLQIPNPTDRLFDDLEVCSLPPARQWKR